MPANITDRRCKGVNQPPTRAYTQTLLQDPTHNAFVSTLFTVWETHYHLRKQALLGLGLHQGLADALASEILIRRYRTNNAQYQTPAEFSAMQLSIAEHVLSRTKAVPVRSRTLDITSVTDPPGCGPSVFALWSDARNAGLPPADATAAIVEWGERVPPQLNEENPPAFGDLKMIATWRAAGDLYIPWEANIEGRHWQVRINDFPDEPMYSLLIESALVGDFDDWPQAWDRGGPGALEPESKKMRSKPFIPADFDAARLVDRYKNGEYEAVWRDLIALGADVRKEPYRMPAEALAEETMRRVRHNLELIVSRLQTLDYKFLVDPWTPCTEEERQTIASCEENGLYLPLSMRAFIERVGHVNLVGSHPKLGPRDREGEWARTDALHFDSSDQLTVLLEHWMETPATKRKPLDFDFGADAEGKISMLEGEDVDESYWFQLPDASADPTLQRCDEATFIEYLRRSFQWGGFPGWEKYPVRPEKELTFLKEGLLTL